MPWDEYIGGITKVVIENGVTSVGNYAFTNAKKLTSVTIGNDVKFIGYNAFLDCGGLTSVTIGGSVTSIENYAFKGNISLTSVIIPNNVISIGKSAFENNTNLTSVTIGNNVTSIGERAFAGCIKLKSATIGESVKAIGGYSFEACSSLTSVTIPNSVIEIGNRAFSDCIRLTSVKIGDGVTSIGDYAFYDCVSLISMTIGKNVNSIGTDGGLKTLKVITMLNPNPPKIAKRASGWNRYGDVDIDKDACILYVPEGSLYNMANFWKDFKNIRYGAPTTQDINEIIDERIKKDKKDEAEKKAGEYARTCESIRNVINKNIDMAKMRNAYNELLKKYRDYTFDVDGDFMIFSDGSHSKLFGIRKDRINDSIVEYIERQFNFNFGKGACTVIHINISFRTSDKKGKVGRIGDVICFGRDLAGSAVEVPCK
jgi:hypothetical protein